MRVLIVDDNPDMREFVAIVLDSENEVVEASGPTSIDWDNPCDVALVDWMMPEAPGDEVALLIRENWPACRILLWTAIDDGAYIKARSLPQFDGGVRKPVSPEGLRRAVSCG